MYGYSTMRTITASYISYQTYTIPDTVTLLSVEENNKVKDAVPFSWYIRWGILYYLDEHREKHTIHPDDEPSTDWKRPAECYSDEEDDH
jgi:hypothetical protein